MLSDYELRVLRDFENDFAKDRSRAAATKWAWAALVCVLIAAALAGCLAGVLVSAVLGAVLGSVGVVAAGGAGWFVRHRHATR